MGCAAAPAPPPRAAATAAGTRHEGEEEDDDDEEEEGGGGGPTMTNIDAVESAIKRLDNFVRHEANTQHETEKRIERLEEKLDTISEKFAEKRIARLEETLDMILEKCGCSFFVI